MKAIFRLLRGRAVSEFHWAGWWHSPKQTARREAYWRELERQYIKLNKVNNSAIPGEPYPK